MDKPTTSDQSTRARPEPAWIPAFIAHLSETANVTQSTRAARINRATAYDHRAVSDDFAKAWDDAIEQATDALEAEARRRAYSGIVRKKFDKGEPIIDPATGEQYVEYEYSDAMMALLLKAHRPEKYRERQAIEHSGPNGGPIETSERGRNVRVFVVNPIAPSETKADGQGQ